MMKENRPETRGGDKRSTYYDRLTSRWKNIPVIVWVVMLAGATAGGLALFSSVTSTVKGLWPPDEAANVDISVRPEDPRFTAGEPAERYELGEGGARRSSFSRAETES